MIDFVSIRNKIFIEFHSIWIMSIYTRAITRTEDPYTLVHLGITVICG